jgi:hypothetical protein
MMGVCLHDIEHPVFADGTDVIQIWRIVANTLNTKSATPTKIGLSAWEFDQGILSLIVKYQHVI